MWFYQADKHLKLISWNKKLNEYCFIYRQIKFFFSFCACSVRSRLAYKSTWMKRGSQKYTDLGNTIACVQYLSSWNWIVDSIKGLTVHLLGWMFGALYSKYSAFRKVSASTYNFRLASFAKSVQNISMLKSL